MDNCSALIEIIFGIAIGTKSDWPAYCEYGCSLALRVDLLLSRS